MGSWKCLFCKKSFAGMNDTRVGPYAFFRAASMRVTVRRKKPHSGMPYVWTSQVQGHLLGNDKGIMW